MTDAQPPETPAAPDLSRFDSDPDAIAWARGKILRAAERAEQFQKHNTDTGSPEWAERWRITAAYMRRTLLGGRGCVIAAFDERLPEWVERLDNPKES